MNEDHDPLNPANQDELPEFSSLDLEECLDYCKDTGDFEPLENAIFENRAKIQRSEKHLIEFTEWVRINAYDTGNKWRYQEDDETYTTKELLEIYKKL